MGEIVKISANKDVKFLKRKQGYTFPSEFNHIIIVDLKQLVVLAHLQHLPEEYNSLFHQKIRKFV